MRFTLLLVLTLLSCTGHRYPTKLVVADSLCAVNPDSALGILKLMEDTMSSAGKADRMYYELLKTDAMNKAYVDMTTDSILKEVVVYYDRHGSANEQMRAHYLLGCAYRDMGEALMALQCYQEAELQAMSELVAAGLPRFFESLQQLYPSISDSNILLCMMTRLRFSSKEIAVTLGSDSTPHGSRRKRRNVPEGSRLGDVQEYRSNISYRHCYSDCQCFNRRSSIPTGRYTISREQAWHLYPEWSESNSEMITDPAPRFALPRPYEGRGVPCG